jgi:hypothetical protein
MKKKRKYPESAADKKVSKYLFSNWTEKIYEEPVKEDEPVSDDNIQPEIDLLPNEQQDDFKIT